MFGFRCFKADLVYTFLFSLREVFEREANESLWVDVHEEWLEVA